MLSRTRLWTPSDPSNFKVTGYVLADGVSYGCSAQNAETCTPSAMPAPKPLGGQRDITSRYMTFRDFLLPDRGGAYLEIDANEPDFEGAAWNLTVTPQGGLPLVMHAAVDGTMVAMEVVYPDASRIRTSYTERKLYETCETASSMRQTTHPKETGYIQTSIVTIEARAILTPADTPIDQPVMAP